MQTKLSVYCERVIEAGWLASLIIVPLFFDVYTERVFEEDKTPLLRSIVLLMIAAWIIRRLEENRNSAPAQEGRPSLWQRIKETPILLPTLILASVYVLSTALSIVPRVSLWGAYIRRQGLYSNLSYIVIFLLLLDTLRTRDQLNRLITIIILTSLPASLYGVVQHYGLDPLPWGGDVITRVSSVAGNPIFIAAYLIMVVPLTLVRVLELFRRLITDESDDAMIGPALLAGAYLFLLLIQLITIMFSQSRGPWLGLGAGLLFFVLIYALRQRVRWLTLSAIALTIAGSLFLVTFNLPNTPLEPLRETPYIGRLGQIFQTETGTGKVRVLIWEGAVQLITANPLRMVTGYGLEAMYVAYNPYYPPDLAHVEARNASPDRSHNETFDSLVTTGLLGFAAYMFLFGSLIYYALRWLGMVQTEKHRNAFIGAWVGGGLIGAILPWFLDHSFRFLGVGLPAGIATGIILYLITYALLHLDYQPPPASRYNLLLLGLLAGVIAHFIEIHFGIAIAATRTYFWTYAALIVLIGVPLIREAEPVRTAPAAPPRPAQKRAKRRRRRKDKQAPRSSRVARAQTNWHKTTLPLSLLMGLILIVIVFDFVSPQFHISAKNYIMLWMFIGVWAVAGLIVISERGEGEESNAWWQRSMLYAGVTLSILLIYLLIHLAWIRQPVAGTLTLQRVVAMTGHLANVVSLLYLFVFMLILLIAGAMLTNRYLPAAFVRQQMSFAYPVIALVVLLPLIVTLNLNISRADIFSKQGSAYERNNAWDGAIVLFQKALDLQPHQDRYFLNLGRAYLEKSRAAKDETERQSLLQKSLDVLLRAQRTSPLNTDHTRNLASLYRAWSEMSKDPQVREEKWQKADQYYAKAHKLSPHNAQILNEWASLYIGHKDYDQALEKLQQSLDLDQEYVDTYLLLGNVYLAQNKFPDAETALRTATKIAPKSLQVWSALGYVYSRENKVQEAIAANETALTINPRDFISHRNLALLYQGTGDISRALQEAQAALSVAPDKEKQAIQGFIAQLQAQIASPQGGGS
ncbi:MAG: tetratricopeptide repeat protein [Chloroflexi bacterium]|nr:tetratricopeptide repeat protein [Chloroflexota bacterium]